MRAPAPAERTPTPHDRTPFPLALRALRAMPCAKKSPRSRPTESWFLRGHMAGRGDEGRGGDTVRGERGVTSPLLITAMAPG